MEFWVLKGFWNLKFILEYFLAKIQITGVLESSDHIHFMIKIPNPSQEPPASSKAANQDLNNMDVFCTFKIKIKS